MLTCSSRMWQVLISKRDKRLHRPRALNAGQGGGRQTISQNNLFVLTTVTLATRTVPAPFDAGITAPLCLDRRPVLQGLAKCPIWKLTAPISPLPLAPQHLQRAGRGAMREQAPENNCPRHVHLPLPHPKRRPLLAWHCVWKEAGYLSPAHPLTGNPAPPTSQGS